jgi:mono/diheme cytochrome c family protein
MIRSLFIAAALAGVAFAGAVSAQPAATPSNGTTQSGWVTTPILPDPSLKTPLLQHGREVFKARCNLCHGDWPKDIKPGMVPMVGTQTLQRKYKGSKPALLEQRTDLTPDMVKFYVRHGVGVMPFFRPTEVSDADLDAIAAYLTRKR